MVEEVVVDDILVAVVVVEVMVMVVVLNLETVERKGEVFGMPVVEEAKEKNQNGLIVNE